MILSDFMLRATIAGLGVALIAAPLGCFVVWRRMAYFGEATAHAALLGIALSLALELPIFAGTLVAALLMAWVVTQLSGRELASDTLLGVTAHAGLALGLVVASFLTGVRIDLMAYLFGDILAVTLSDLYIIWFGVIIGLALIYWRWSPMLISTLNEELAYSNDINPKREKLFLTLALAVTVAVSIKVVGLLLISALLIIPAAAARNISQTPETMVITTAIIGVISAVSGLQFSYFFNSPPGPSIVCVSLVCFLILSSKNLIKLG
jgi:zinc transport system permease protein|tara:strand:- start:979 stop:1773 length:795 start_codon:yes stop_codon:yes gene_type:complete